MAAQSLAQGGMQQMGGRVVKLDIVATRDIDLGVDRHAGRCRARIDVAEVQEHAALFLGIGDGEREFVAGDLAGITDLAARFAVERCGIEHEHAGGPGLDGIHRLAFHQEGHHAGSRVYLAIPHEIGGLAHVVQPGVIIRAELAGRSGALALGGHLAFEAGIVDRQLTLARHVVGQIDGETVGVVELEDRFAGNLRTRHGRDGVLENLHARGQRFGKPLFFLGHHALDLRVGLGQFGIGLAHQLVERCDQFVEEGPLCAQLVTVTNGPAHDPTQDIPPALVGRHDAVGDEKRRGADMIGHDFQRRQLGLGGRARDAHGAGRSGHQRLEYVDAVVVVRALHDGRDTFQAHAGIDRGLGQIDHFAVRLAVVLHEHQVPDLDETIAVFFRRAGRPAPDVRAVVVEDLGARTTRPGIAHLPEVVLGTDARQAFFRDTDLVFPDCLGLGVFFIDRDPELVLGQPQLLGQKPPGKVDGLALEVITEREITQHLEKRVVAGRVAHVFQIVMLAAGAYTALGRHGARVITRVTAEEHIFERHHAGIGEQQRRIGRRHEAG